MADKGILAALAALGLLALMLSGCSAPGGNSRDWADIARIERKVQ